jgi:hypothetical protein
VEPPRLRDHAKAVTSGHTDVVLYTLRHSHASACHYAGFTPPEAAERIGHGLPLHWETYAHAIKTMSGKRYAGLDELITDARACAGVAPELRKAESGE